MDIPGAASSLASLLVICGVLGGAAFLLRRLRGTGWAKLAGPASPITLVASRQLGGRNTLVIAEAQGQRFLIGIGRNGMTAIGRLDEQG